MPLPDSIANRLTLPLIAAPMLSVSGPDLVIAACKAGVIGAFPVANARSVEQLDAWLTWFEAEIVTFLYGGRSMAPVCPNLIIRRASVKEELACLVRHKVEMVITSVGSPEIAVGPLHDVGCLVLADVATMRHAEKAIAAGVDGLILLTAGAGGQTGWMNSLAFVRAVRAIFAGPIVMAGGIIDGRALWAARVLGCDLAYMGTRFIATHESMASDAYKRMLVESTMDDVMVTRAFTGLDTNMLRPSIVAAGLDPANLPERVSIEQASAMHGSGGTAEGAQRWRDIWSAGHSVSGVTRVQSAADLIAEITREYDDARRETAELLRCDGRNDR
jgi:nitronate monooxygenase